MSMAVQVDPLPLASDETGTLRISGTRVTLDSVVEAFSEGLAAEEIVQQFPVLPLPDVYAVIAYYLNHREDLDAYLAKRRTEADALRAELETARPTASLRQRLLARRPVSV